MAANYQAVIAVPFGQLGVQARDGVVTELDFCQFDQYPLVHCQALQGLTEFIEAYFRGESYPLPAIQPQGTAFQQRVWQALLEIPFGELRSYGELAKMLGSHARAVGQACRRNPIPILIPCHRVVARDHLGGFAGATAGESMAIKRYLLAHEGLELSPAQAQQASLSL